MSGGNVAVYLNGEFYKYYKFYQIYDYNFLGFNGNDPIDYLKFDSAQIDDGEIQLYRKEKQRYKAFIFNGRSAQTLYSEPMDNIKDAIQSFVKDFDGHADWDKTQSIEFNIWNGEPEWENKSTKLS